MIRRRTVIALFTTGALAAGAGAGIDAATAKDDGAGATTEARHGPDTTETIVRGNLKGSISTAGTLRFAGGQKIQSDRGGIVTGMPAPGSVVRRNQRLYLVDNVPVVLMRGRKPAWRAFEPGMTDGPDVKQLEQNLHALGHLDREPDDKFTWYTARAIRDWQKAKGLERTGTLPLGSIVFNQRDLRIGTLTAQVGDHVGPGSELLNATSTEQVVDASIGLDDQRLAAVGARVTLSLPGGKHTTGKMTSIGTPTDKDGDQGADRKTVIPIVIKLDKPAAAQGLQEASVTVTIPSEQRENVLSVPLEALLALDPTTFGIEIVQSDGTTRRVPVKLGLFAAGRVEVSGSDVRAGERVVVPNR